MTLYRVKYKGLSTIREISGKDLKKHNVGVDRDLVWSPSNNHTVVVDGMSDRLLEILRADRTFTVSEVKDQGEVESEEIIKGETLDDTAAVVVDGSTGQESENPAGPAGSGQGAAGPKGGGTGRTGRGSSTAGGGTVGGGSST